LPNPLLAPSLSGAPRDLNTDFAITYSAITQHQPAGDIPHAWK
jgi:hypothetical protein